MKPTRWNSIRANKKWIGITATGTALILACWIHSLFFIAQLQVPLRSKKLVWLNFSANVAMAVTRSDLYPATHFSLIKNHKLSRLKDSADYRGILLPLPRIEPGRGGGVVTLPYWLLLILFLGIQYALLPKTLPPPKGEGNLPDAP